ncbi:MAG: GNAT family N-acetyltransferase, partial [Magnetospirillum sp.]|nr:GNAT family N-acetyltransferase [Magnetospirillum sp.]
MTDDDQPPCARPGTVWDGHPLLTARLRLRPLGPADEPELVRLLDDWDVVRHTAAIPHPYTAADAAAFVALMAERRARRQGVALAMERSLDGRLVGCVGFGLDHDGTPELGFWVGRAFWGQGLATEALRRLIRHLLADLGMPRVWASAHPDNHASIRVQERLGLGLAGVETVALPARGQSVAMPVRALDAAAW